VNGKIEVIRKKDLQPGDTLLIYAPEDKLESCVKSAAKIFASYKVKVVGVPEEVRLQFMGKSEELTPEELSKQENANEIVPICNTVPSEEK